MTLASLLTYFLNGLTVGMLLFLIASGLSLIFGVLRVLNFAHGTLYMLGAYLAFQTVKILDNFWLAMLIAPLAVALIGAAVERVILRPVYDREATYQLLLTFGLILVTADVVRLTWGPIGKSFSQPPLLRGGLSLLGRSYPSYNLLVILCGLIVALGLWAFLTRTRYGCIIRAAASDREMANALGINVPRLYTLVFALGAWLGGLGGVLAGPIRTISLGMDVEIIVDAFAVVVIGGLGSYPGALLGSFLIGQLQSFGILLIPRFEMAFMFILMAVILIIRPRGLLGEEEVGR